MTNGRHNEKNLYIAFELSQKEWRLCMGDGNKHRNVRMKAGHQGELKQAIELGKKKFDLPSEAKVYSCFEAGRDGFWIHHLLTKLGVENIVVDSASIEVNRRQRRTKTDRLDAEKLQTMLIRFYRLGEKGTWKVVRVPTPEQEDERREHREYERLQKERKGHLSRIRSLLAMHGVSVKQVSSAVTRCHDWEGKALPPRLQEELTREWDRVEKTVQQMVAMEKSAMARIKAPTTHAEQVAKKLYELKAIGPRSSWLFSHEFFAWRKFQNRRQVAGLAGLGGGRYDSGSRTRDLGITKSGNKRVRRMAVEVAWLWLRYQPTSALTLWYKKRFGEGSKRMKRIGIVAVARKLLIELWRYVEKGQIPAGAVLKTV